MTNSTGCSQPKYKCHNCKDTGYIIKAWEGAGLAVECSCLEIERMIKRFKSAMIPEEFKKATFVDYQETLPVQQKMKKAAMDYVQEFGKTVLDEKGRQKGNSLGFIAVVGDQKLNKLTGAKKAEMKKIHNNYGLGKTHLLVAIAKELIKKGESVLMVSDVALMDELMANKNDDNEAFNKRVYDLIHVPVLIWDEIGKSAPTDPKRAAYFHIVNERYKAQRPILFSSNEDRDTLEDRIGGATTSRLFGMAFGRLYQVEGPDYRLTGGAKVV